MKKYNGQALAIVLVLLVVGSLIGFALYTRFAHDSERIVDERAASEANELAETMASLLNTVAYDSLNNPEFLQRLEGCSSYSEGCYRDNMNLDDLSDLFFLLGLEVDFNKDLGAEYCFTELGISHLSGEGIEIEKDAVQSVFLDSVTWDDSCHHVEFKMENLGDSVGFVMSTFYVHRDDEGIIQEYKPYDPSDVLGFKYYGSGGSNWQPYNPPLSFGNAETYKVSKDTFVLDEVRFKSLGGSSKLSWSSSGSCNLRGHLLIEVGATCGEKYVGKTFVLPEEYFAPLMFDYVYFQGQGDLIPLLADE